MLVPGRHSRSAARSAAVASLVTSLEAAGKVKELFAIADTNRNGNLEPEELKHCILSSDSEQHAAADLYVFVHNICSTIPKPKPAVPLGAAEALQEFVEYTARNAKDFAKANWRMVRSNITHVVRSVRVATDTPAIVPG